MANSSGLNRTGVLSRVTVAAITAALVGTTTAAVAADAPQERAASAATQPAPKASAFAAAAASVVTPIGQLHGVDSAGDLWSYWPNGSGFNAREDVGYGWSDATRFTKGDQNADGEFDGAWAVLASGSLYYVGWSTTPAKVGSGWGIYNSVVSAGNLGGGAADDVLARDAAGNLYLYLGYGNGKLATRVKVGPGWQAYNQITGKGDLNGDGKADVIARDKSGVLWLYKGTGNYKAPFAGRTKIGSGWGGYNTILSTGDVDGNGAADLLGRDAAGALWLHKGTGVASSPFKPRVKVGTSGWNSYRILF
ncbi:FG-GAP repeat domain-containing protein [Streptomyces sp. NPDC096319]|uniref:FG-GAP repeat domain-containing protein n=1 Tax=Streptomyces sp. NPDC096319 TaxID=3366084 RepID=UPI0037F92732